MLYAVNTHDIPIMGYFNTPRPFRLQNIQRVEVLKRLKNTVFIMRFKDVQLRIGMHDLSEDGSGHFDKNPLVGHYAEGNMEPVAVFEMPLGGVTGRFLTLQKIGLGVLEIAEVYVYV